MQGSNPKRDVVASDRVGYSASETRDLFSTSGSEQRCEVIESFLWAVMSEVLSATFGHAEVARTGWLCFCRLAALTTAAISVALLAAGVYVPNEEVGSALTMWGLATLGLWLVLSTVLICAVTWNVWARKQRADEPTEGKENGRAVAMTETKKLLIEYDPSQRRLGSSNFLVPIGDGSGKSLLGLKDHKRYECGQVVYLGRAITAKDVFARLVDSGHEFESVERTMAALDAYLQMLQVYKIGNILRIETSAEDASGFRLIKIADHHPFETKKLP